MISDGEELFDTQTSEDLDIYSPEALAVLEDEEVISSIETGFMKGWLEEEQ